MYRLVLMEKNMKNLEFYVHIPFCVKKCAYCDFLSFTVGEEQKEAYVTALLKEIDEWQPKKEYCAVSVFLGGGTPSVLSEDKITMILEALRKKVSFSETVEITIECNPGTLTKEKLLCYQKSGVNRLSLGLQSAQERELKMLGRIHTYEEFLENFWLARAVGFTNINVDLMSALPGQKIADWEDTLQKVAKLDPEHISAYSLIIEEETPFYEKYAEDLRVREAGGECRLLPTEEEERQMYGRTREILNEYGYHRYEISNYAKEGKECRHNVGYWVRTDYKGFGLGAASLLDNVRFSNGRNLKAYLNGDCQEKEECLSKNAQMEETMFLGLRLTEGVSKKIFQKVYGCAMEDVYGSVLKHLRQQGLLKIDREYVALTEKGMDISNYVMAQFLLED